MKKYLIAILGIIFNVALLTGLIIYAFTSKDNEGYTEKQYIKEYVFIHEEEQQEDTEKEDSKEVEEIKEQEDSKKIDNNINSSSTTKKYYQYN